MHHQAVDAFTDSMGIGLRAVALIVLIGAVLIARSFRTTSRRAETSAALSVAAPGDPSFAHR